MKQKTKISANVATFYAVAVLVFLPYTNCKERCSRLHNMSCHIERIQATNSLWCCGHAKPQPKNSSSEKCNGACCISSLPPTATVANQTAGLDTQIIPNVCENLALIESNTTLKTVIPTANSPPYRHSETQAMLCVFVI